MRGDLIGLREKIWVVSLDCKENRKMRVFHRVQRQKDASGSIGYKLKKMRAVYSV